MSNSIRKMTIKVGFSYREKAFVIKTIGIICDGFFLTGFLGV